MILISMCRFPNTIVDVEYEYHASTYASYEYCASCGTKLYMVNFQKEVVVVWGPLILIMLWDDI